jgi:large conductance mechanosensitive channel
MLEEFKKFLITGNVIDMAVGFIFGAAFATVIKSLVSNIIMPPIGLLMGGVDFSSLFIALDGKETHPWQRSIQPVLRRSSWGFL